MGGIDLSTLNESQRKIATTLDAPLFVEAGAGSGKTFTLTRRVVWALSEGSGEDGKPFLDDLSQVLVITFTNAAAQEIRERVRSSLHGAGMHDAALAVDEAWISTIHGMCQRILRRYALELGIDPAFGVCGTHREDELINIAVERAVGAARRAAKPGSIVASMFESFEYTGVVARVRALLTCARATAGGFDALRLAKGGSVSQGMRDLLRSYESLASVPKLTPAASTKVNAALAALQPFCALPPGSQTPERAGEALQSCAKPPRSKATADLVKEIGAELTHAKALVALERAAAFGPVLKDLALRTGECYTELKRAEALLDNDDLISLALEAVTNNPEIAWRYAGRFRLVMVDEFQDTDAKQLKLISALAGADLATIDDADRVAPRHMATVGDAQQSIYRFRGADVSVFNDHGTRVPKDGHVRLNVNYRSHKDILSFVDKVCGPERGVLDDFMHLDANPKREDGYKAKELPRVAVEMVSGPARGVSALVRTNQLAQQMASRLADYRDAGQRAGDMALLLGSTTHAALYIDALRERGLECVVTGGSTFTKAPEVAVMLSLLRTLANPRDTQSGLFPLLSSEMFELDANDFLQLGTRRQEKLDAPTKRTIDRGLMSLELFGAEEPSARLRHAHEVLARALDAIRVRPVADVCLDAVRDSGWLSRLEGQGAAGIAREANVLAAIRYIRDLTDEMGLGPVRAAAEFAHWLEVSKVPPASLAGAEQDTVRVMTIHASKGLEFPVVAVAECWSDPKQDGGLWSIAQEGVRKVLIRPKGSVKLDGAEDAARSGDLVDVALELRDATQEAEAQEKARLLYVALTRAREALVVGINFVVSQSGVSPKLAVGTMGALFDGKMPSLEDQTVDYGGTAPAQVRYVALDKDSQTEGNEAQDCGARMAELYPLEESVRVPVALTRAREDVFSYSSARDALEKALGAGDTVEDAGTRPKRPALPPRERREAQEAGASGESDADKATNLGSAFHMAAQAMVESPVPIGEARVDAIARRWSLGERQRSRLDAALARWASSDLRREALSWGLVRAEVPFFALSGNDPNGHYVEGAIDLLCTHDATCTGDALVVDYKTGDIGLSEEQMRARHAAQAKLYAQVLLSLGFAHVTCAFMAVETGMVVRWEFGTTC